MSEPETPAPQNPSVDEEVLPPEPEKKEGTSMWDWVLLAVLAAGGAGFWLWYHNAKERSERFFAHADSLYVHGRLPEALTEYRTLDEKGGFGYISKHNDSVLYQRLDTLTDLQERTERLASELRAARASGDTILLGALADSALRDSTGFLPAPLVDSLRKQAAPRS